MNEDSECQLSNVMVKSDLAAMLGLRVVLATHIARSKLGILARRSLVIVTVGGIFTGCIQQLFAFIGGKGANDISYVHF